MMKLSAIVLVALVLLAPPMADSQTTWFKYEGNPVLNAGAAGSWEERGIIAGSVLRPDSLYRMWYGGHDRNYAGRIGYATSPDGIRWTKDSGNPVMSAAYGWEGSVNAFPCVLFDGSRYKIWYTGNNYVGYATSDDGRTGWTKSSTPVLGPGSGWDAAAANGPWVLGDTVGGFKMWYTAYRGYELAMIGYATGATETAWTKYQDAALGPDVSGSWDEREVTFPKVLQEGQTYHMWFAGTKTGIEYNQVGYAVSSDAKHWTKHPQNPVLPVGPSGTWDQTGVTPGGVIDEGGLYRMWYSGNDGAHYRTGYAVSPKGFRTTVSNGRQIPAGDTITITVHVDSPHGLSFWAYIDSSAGSTKIRKDTVQLYDDGLHGDSLAGDGLFANAWLASVRGNYWASVSLTLNDTVRFGAIDLGGIEVVGARHRVPQDYATIQAAIDASADGDTVLVSENTYRENIRFRGKAIVVGSLYLVDGDTTHIAKTIIDGSGSAIADSGSVVYFIEGEDTTSVLTGFTIQGGSGTRFWFNSSALGTYWMRGGGGILCYNSGARITRNTITRNRISAAVSQGGGVQAVGTGTWYPFIRLEDNTISDNYVQGASYTNMEWSGGAGIALIGVEARVAGNVIERDTSIGTTGAYGAGLTFAAYSTGYWPSGEIADNVIRSNVARSVLQGAVGTGLIVIGTGQVTIRDNLIAGNSGASSSSSGWAQAGGLSVEDGVLSESRRKTVVGNRFVGNTVSNSRINDGAGMGLYHAVCTISGNEFRDNSVLGSGGVYDLLGPGGGALCVHGSSFRIVNNIFTHNSTSGEGGALNIAGTAEAGVEQTLFNNTIVDNHAVLRAGALRLHLPTGVQVYNTIFWNDSAQAEPEIYAGGVAATIQYCDIKGGWPGTGNIDLDPRLALPRLDSLNTNSPCIGAGVATSTLATDIHGHPRTQPAGSVTDIGAEESFLANPVVGAIEENETLPLAFALEQNYPNPFNPTTTIRYALPHRSHVKLTVFTLLGEGVATLVDGEIEAGYHEVRFDASGLASGVYFYRIQAGNFVGTRKIVLVR